MCTKSQTGPANGTQRRRTFLLKLRDFYRRRWLRTLARRH